MTKPHVLGVDLSMRATGVADDDDLFAIVTTNKNTDDERIDRIADIIRRRATGSALVVIENYVTSSRAASVLGMLHGVVRNHLHNDGTTYALVAPGTLKKYATGRGNADKAEMRMALYKRTGIDEADDNKVDALWLRYAGLWHLGHPAVELPLAQVAALDKVAWP